MRNEHILLLEITLHPE